MFPRVTYVIRCKSKVEREGKKYKHIVRPLEVPTCSPNIRDRFAGLTGFVTLILYSFGRMV